MYCIDQCDEHINLIITFVVAYAETGYDCASAALVLYSDNTGDVLPGLSSASSHNL